MKIVNLIRVHKYFTVLDLASGFYQNLMTYEFELKYNLGQYISSPLLYCLDDVWAEYVPTTFQEYIDDTLTGFHGAVSSMDCSNMDEVAIFYDEKRETMQQNSNQNKNCDILNKYIVQNWLVIQLLLNANII